MITAGAVTVAAGAGAAIKMGIKYADATSGGREYDSAGYDAVTGGVNGLLAPITAGFGGAIGKTVAARFGLQVVKEGAEVVAEQGAKEVVVQAVQTGGKSLIDFGNKYVGGNLFERGAAYGAESATIGATSGAPDAYVRNGLTTGHWFDENAAVATGQGLMSGASTGPLMDGGFRVAGKAGNKISGFLFKGKTEVIADATVSVVEHNTPKTVKSLVKSIELEVNTEKPKVFIPEEVTEPEQIAKILSEIEINGQKRFTDDKMIDYISKRKIPTDYLNYLLTARDNKLTEKDIFCLKSNISPTTEKIALLDKILNARNGQLDVWKENVPLFLNKIGHEHIDILNKNPEIIEKLFSVRNESLSLAEIFVSIENLTPEKVNLLKRGAFKLLDDLFSARKQGLEVEHIADLLKFTNDYNIDLIPEIINKKILAGTDKEQFRFKNITSLINTLKHVNGDKKKQELLSQFLQRDESFGIALETTFKDLNDSNIGLLESLFKEKKLCGNDICALFAIINNTPLIPKESMNILLSARGKSLATENICNILGNTDKNNIVLLEHLLQMRKGGDYRFSPDEVTSIMLLTKGKANAGELLKNNSKFEELIKDFNEFARLQNRDGVGLFKSSGGEIATVNAYGIKNLLRLKETNPKEYSEMMELVKLAQENIIPAYVFQKLHSFGYINPLVKADINKVVKGESIVPRFIDEAKALSSTQLADVVSINGKIYVNEGNIAPMGMTEDTYLKLFPPIKRFALSQGELVGNCYYISGGLNDFLLNPNARIKLYKMFKQDGDDIIVTIPGEAGHTERFINGEINLPKNGKYVEGALGLQMLERAYGKVKYKQKNIGNELDLDESIENMRGGTMSESYNFMLGETKGEVININPTENEVPKPMFNINLLKTQDATSLEKLEKILSSYSGQENQYLLGAGTKPSNKIESPLEPDYSIFSGHAYSIANINSAPNSDLKCNT